MCVILILRWLTDMIYVAGCVNTGRGDNPKFQMPFKYYEGQRAEAVWEGLNRVSLEELQRLAETARQMHLYFMDSIVGWQEVNYSRWFNLNVFWMWCF